MTEPTRDPLRAFMSAARTMRESIATEYVPESPGWAQVFMTRVAAPAGRAVVVTHDGADWTISLWRSPATFYEEQEADAYESYRGEMSAMLVARAAAKMLRRASAPAVPA